MHDDITSPMGVHDASVDVEVSFEQNLLPILTAKCALAGCHVADGPHGLDYRTYESFKTGGEHGPAFIPGSAEESAVVIQIVLGNMPLAVHHFLILKFNSLLIGLINRKPKVILSCLTTTMTTMTMMTIMTTMPMTMTMTTTMTMMTTIMTMMTNTYSQVLVIQKYRRG